MNIDIKLIEKVVNEMVSITIERMSGKCEPSLSKGDAIDRFGTISEFVITLHDKIIEESGSDELREQVWKLKEKSDDELVKLMNLFI